PCGLVFIDGRRAVRRGVSGAERAGAPAAAGGSAPGTGPAAAKAGGAAGAQGERTLCAGDRINAGENGSHPQNRKVRTLLCRLKNRESLPCADGPTWASPP